jgi:hypothetical protein
MSKPLRSLIGLLLLITTISLASCQSMLKTMASDKEQKISSISIML